MIPLRRLIQGVKELATRCDESTRHQLLALDQYSQDAMCTLPGDFNDVWKETLALLPIIPVRRIMNDRPKAFGASVGDHVIERMWKEVPVSLAFCGIGRDFEASIARVEERHVSMRPAIHQWLVDMGRDRHHGRVDVLTFDGRLEPHVAEEDTLYDLQFPARPRDNDPFADVPFAGRSLCTAARSVSRRVGHVVCMGQGNRCCYGCSTSHVATPCSSTP